MRKKLKFSRRSFVLANSALFSLVATTGAATTMIYQGRNALKTNLPKRFGQKPLIDWNTATYKEMALLTNRTFNGLTPSGMPLDLVLSRVEKNNSGASRPKHLARSEGMVLVFDSPQAKWLFESGETTVKIWQNALGEANLLVNALPKRHGGYVIEIVLN